MAGNANSGRKPAEKSFAQALRMCLNKDGDGRRLRLIAEQLVKQAEAGEQWAIKEIADRLDGRPAQILVGDDGADPISFVGTITRHIVDPQSSD